MTVENGQEFIDYYDLLQVDPKCDARILDVAYRYFAKLYHPDHAETADVEKFNEVSDAYAVLRDHDKRAEYDQIYFARKDMNNYKFERFNEPPIDQKTALSDAEAHEKILLHLYKRRRENANEAGVAGWLIQEVLDCSEDHFEFHVWYLKSKGFIEITEQGTLAVTIQGVDHVFSISRTNFSEKLRIAQQDSTED